MRRDTLMRNPDLTVVTTFNILSVWDMCCNLSQLSYLCFVEADSFQQCQHQSTHLWQVRSKLMAKVLQQIMGCIQDPQPLPAGHAL